MVVKVVDICKKNSACRLGINYLAARWLNTKVLDAAPENVTDAELKCDLLRIQIHARIRQYRFASNDIKIRNRGKLVQYFLINVRREIGKLWRSALERQHGYGVADRAD